MGTRVNFNYCHFLIYILYIVTILHNIYILFIVKTNFERTLIFKNDIGTRN